MLEHPMHTNDALSPNTMSTSMAGDDHSEASSLSSFEGPLPERPSEARRRIAPIVPGFFDRAVFADRPNSALDSARPTSAANAEELGCTRLNRLIFIGGRAIASDLMALRKRRITHVLNMAVECENFFEEDLLYCHISCTDKNDDGGNFRASLHRIVDFIDSARVAQGRVLVHCNSGISRSSAAVLAYLVRRGPRSGLPDSGRARDSRRPPSARSGMALLAALEWLKERRPIASPHPAYMDELVEWEVAWRKRPSLDSERYSDNRYSRAEDLKLLLTPRSARAEAKEEDVWRPSAPPPGQRREWKE